MEISKIKAVVFDCDGVLFDTALANRKFYDEVLLHFARPQLTDEQFYNVHMMTVGAAVEYLFPDRADHPAVYECLKQIGYAKFIPHMKMEKGLKPLLNCLKAAGVKRAIATNRTNTMESVLEDHKLTPCFDMVVTAADVKKPKPHPEQLIKIMKTLDLLPEEMIFIGDSIYDQEAAKEAGTWFIAFKHSGLDAHFHVDRMGQIGEILGVHK